MRVTLFGRATVAQKMEQFENVIQLLVDAGHEVLLNESLYSIQGRLQNQYNLSKINANSSPPTKLYGRNGQLTL